MKLMMKTALSVISVALNVLCVIAIVDSDCVLEILFVQYV